MRDKHSDIITSVLSTIGISSGVQDLTNILNLVLLIISIVNILFVVGFRIYKHIKDKKYDKIGDELQCAYQEIEALKTQIKEVDNDGEN